MQSPPLQPDDLIKYGSFEFIVIDVFKMAGEWFITAEELHTRHIVGTAAENCTFIDVAQINLFGSWE